MSEVFEKLYDPMQRLKDMPVEFAEAEKVQHLLLSRAPVMSYVFRDGSTAKFLNHVYTTNVQAHIDEFHAEAKSHPGGNWIIDPAKLTVDMRELMRPQEYMREKIHAEERQKILTELGIRDLGEYRAAADAFQRSVGNSQSLGAATALSSDMAAAHASQKATGVVNVPATQDMSGKPVLKV